MQLTKSHRSLIIKVRCLYFPSHIHNGPSGMGQVSNNSSPGAFLTSQYFRPEKSLGSPSASTLTPEKSYKMVPIRFHHQRVLRKLWLTEAQKPMVSTVLSLLTLLASKTEDISLASALAFQKCYNMVPI